MAIPRIYAGIGSRETPEDVLVLMREIGRLLALQGWLLRSGGAPGADTAFDQGAIAGNGAREIYLPWASFARELRQHGPDTDSSYILPERAYDAERLDHAMALAEQYHPYWHSLKQGARTLMARNIFQILGPDLRSPVGMVVCYAKGSVFDLRNRVVDVRGGTGQAVRLAAEEGCVVYNLAIPEHRSVVEAFIQCPPTPRPRRLSA